MKVISFLGTTKYSPTTYVFQDKEYQTHLFPEALYEFFQPEELLVCITQEAKTMHFDALCQRLEGRIKPQAVEIPFGRSESELWQIFDRLAGSVNAGNTVVFDITNAFRSLPLLIFIAIAYLRSAQDVHLKAITYGAFEARENEKTPVFDLSPFIALLDWTTATDKFLKTGNATELVERLREAHRMPYKLHAASKADLPRQLQNVATCIEAVTQSMRTTRLHEAMQSAVSMVERLEQARSEAERWAKPFAILLEQTRQAYLPFTLDDPLADVQKNLAVQLKLLQWYKEKDQVVQAITLAREWLISLTIYQLGWDIINDRSVVEAILNDSADALQKARPFPTPMYKVRKAEDIVREWNWVRDFRNDVAHCGMRRHPDPTTAIIKKTEELHNRLASLGVELLGEGETRCPQTAMTYLGGTL